MKKIIIAVLVVVALGTAGFIVSRDNSSDNDQADTESTPNTNSSSGGSYVDYSQEALATASGTKILFFHAPWCPQCRALENDITTNGVPEGVTILKVDYDSNQTLRQKYGVTLQTTLVKVDDNDELVEKYVAYDSPTVDALSKNLL